ncbi:MAG: acyl-CoA dehydratase activase [Bacteroidales bacterium]
MHSGAVGRRAMGVEIGSLYLKCVEIDDAGQIVSRVRERHCGNIAPLLARCEERSRRESLPLGIIARASHPTSALAFDPVVGLTTGARARCPGASNILEVGGSSLTLVHADANGRVLSVHRNSLCAAGSGSFLDEQAARLNIDRDAIHTPFADPPGIATRCAVFAKSDLIHRQQEGWSPESVWSGLCRGLADGVLRTLTYGRPLVGLTALCGGVARDPSFVWWFERSLHARNGHGNGNGHGHAHSLVVVPDPEFTVALGAALLAAQSGNRVSVSVPAAVSTPVRQQRPPLSLVRSRYPEHAAASSYADELGNEITIHRAHSNGDPVDVVLGLDIGSTSTKCALVAADGGMLLDIYRRTEGDPLGAVRKLLNAIVAVGARDHLPLRVRGAATTGSGRKIAAKVFGADLVVNEISAHAAGAIHVAPGAETVFEIGGQDAKYMAIRRGRVVDANMNYVCAAGTGSFVEECAAKLGYRVQEVGDAVLGVAPPFTSSRCTVFMEQDVLGLLQKGASRQEAMGAVLYSVVENYLERVVGRRPVSRDRLFFQGATARNRGLVAAIENLLDVEVVVSPYCHVMGAYGAALLARAALTSDHTRFRGLDLGSRGISLEAETCELCINKCRLTRAAIEGEGDRPAWGMVCGRDEQDTKMRVPAEYALVRKRTRLAMRPDRGGMRKAKRGADGTRAVERSRPRLGLPLALSSFSFLPFWTSLFGELGIDVVPSAVTDRACLEKAKEHAPPEVCLPLKAAHGHVAQLADDPNIDAIFLPHMIADRPTEGIAGSKFCPYVEVAPSLAISAARNGAGPKKPVLAPVVDLTLSPRWNAERLVEALKPMARVTRQAAERAFAAAIGARDRQQDALLEMGRDVLGRAAGSLKPVVVLIGRPYNTLDTGMSLDIPYHIADCGFDVVPMDCLPFEPHRLTGELRQMFWHYGQRILAAIAKTAETDGMYGVYLTSFGCGPDSFLLSYAEAIMGDKPFLVLELDEHGSNGGYHTRIEAFLDVVRSHHDAARRSVQASDRPTVGTPTHPEVIDSRTLGLPDSRTAASQTVPWPPPDTRPPVDWKRRTLWIPPMHPVGNPLFAATLRGAGYDARPLPPEDDEAYSLGKRLMRGAECLPCPLTVGTFLKKLGEEEREGRDVRSESALFMPASNGPCRFGQYAPLARLVFDRVGYAEVPILSPSQETTNFDLGASLRAKLFETLIAGDILLKMRSRIRPYETRRGETDDLVARWVERFEQACESGSPDWKRLIQAAAADFGRVQTSGPPRPLVGVVGEIYVRCNRYANADVLNVIEGLGGEPWLATVGEWVEYCGWADLYRSRQARAGLRAWIDLSLTYRYMLNRTHRMYAWAGPLLADRREPHIEEVVKAGSEFLPVEFEGESLLTLGRTVLFAAQGASLVVNCAPFNCMHGNITTALFEGARDRLGVPVVNMFYDGSEDNGALATFLAQATARSC